MTTADDFSSRQHKHTPDSKQHDHTLPTRCARKAAAAVESWRRARRGGFTQKRRMRQYTKTSPITVLNAFEDTVLADSKYHGLALSTRCASKAAAASNRSRRAQVASNSMQYRKEMMAVRWEK